MHSIARRFTLRARLALALFPVALFGTAAAAHAQELPRTWQEENDFKAGPTPFEPLMDYWFELDAVSDKISMMPLTETLLGRTMQLLTISDIPISSPQDALRSGKAIVFVGPSVHGGEVSPKESFQLVARELVGGSLQHILDDVIVIGVPLVNPDGGEVQRRTNEAGYDMNRDYVKLESQEIQALVTQVMTQWTPDIHVDGHHGGSDPYVITYQGTLNPAADPALREWTYGRIFPRIRAAVEAEDYRAFDYSGPRIVDGVQGWGSTSVEPRKHHVYTGLTNTIGILLETPRNSRRVMRDGTVAEIPQEDRYYHQIRGGVLALTAILEVAAENRDELRTLTSGTRQRAIEAGVTGAEPVVLDYELVNRGNETVWMPDASAQLGYAPQEVPVFLKYETTRTTTRPKGYLLPPGMAAVLTKLFDHGIAVYQFREPMTLSAEVYDATSVKVDSYFQGHYLKSVEVEKSTEDVEVGPGWFWIPTAQSMGRLITYLFEPETDDNLITWGWADHIIEVTPQSIDEALATLYAVRGPEELTPERRAQLQSRAEEMMQRRQRVPMMRVLEADRLPVERVRRFMPSAGNRVIR